MTPGAGGDPAAPGQIGCGVPSLLFVHVLVPATVLWHAAQSGASWRAAAAVLALALFWAACWALASRMPLPAAAQLLGFACTAVIGIVFAAFALWHAVAAVLN